MSVVAKGPIFVVGNSRSGTTMLGRMLGLHSKVFMFGEVHFFEQLVSGNELRSPISFDEGVDLFSKLLCVQREGYFKYSNPSKYVSEVREVLGSDGVDINSPLDIYSAFLKYEAENNGKVISCEQTPRNLFYLSEILNYFPEARVINMVRDPRDVLLSQKRKWRRRGLCGDATVPLRASLVPWGNYHPITISWFWRSSNKCAEKYSADPRVTLLHFEEIIASPEGAMRKVCDFIGLPFEKEMLDVPQVGSSSVADMPEKKGVSAQRSGVWKKGGLTSAEVFINQVIAGSFMEKYGYEKAKVFPNPLLLLFYIVLFPVKTAVAIFFNFNRMRSMVETLKRRLFHSFFYR